MRKFRRINLFLCFTFLFLLFASAQKKIYRQLDSSLKWYGKNRERLNQFIRNYGIEGKNYDSKNKPVAVFDWDNSVIKNDIGSAVVYWMIQNDKILQPPKAEWGNVIPYLTEEAKKRLSEVCKGISPGKSIKTSTNIAAANEFVSLYDRGTLANGNPAFAGYNHRTYLPSIALQSQLQAGYTPEEIRSFTRKVIHLNLKAPIGKIQLVGTTPVDGYIRIYKQVHNLIQTMQASGFEVWICSASPQYVVEPFAKIIGVERDHVIGLRPILDAAGKITYDFQGCGLVEDGKNALLNYMDGKRCWINRVIYKDKTASAINQRPFHKRQVFGMGDANTDITFLKDATGLKLVINRNKLELMAHAYHNLEKNWIINPMFIDPKPKRKKYPCSKTGCVDKNGKMGPCIDAKGNIIPDQEDSIYLE